MAERSCDVLIVGGGLSGLALAKQLEAAQIDYCLVEAKSRLGGRIDVGSYQGAAFDLGPAWFWPGQPRMARLIDEYGLAVFEQYASGEIAFEDNQGRVYPGQGYASMQGSYRLTGGLVSLVDAIASSLNEKHLITGARLERLVDNGAGLDAFFSTGINIKAKRVVLAMPPRVAASITFEPALDESAIKAMAAIPTWMAGQAKFLAVYPSPFWRDQGLSGDVSSQHGPMVEIHDASDPNSGLGALFGFIGVPANLRRGRDAGIEQAALAQLARLFGEPAAQPLVSFYRDWSEDKYIAVELDAEPLYGHPHYGLPKVLNNLWNGCLYLGSTETASEFGGYLEGALEAAERVSQQLIQ